MLPLRASLPPVRRLGDGGGYPPVPKAFLQPLTKDEINELPLRKWTGLIRLVQTDAQSDAAIERLRGEALLGLDTETRPVFKKGKQHRPALLQLAGTGVVYLFQLGRLTRFDGIRELLESADILKAGVGLGQDLKQLADLFPVVPQGIVDLADMAQRGNMPHRGLRTLAAACLGCRISKRAQCSNWDVAQLLPYQVEYAATDAWISRELYRILRHYGLHAGGEGGREQE